VFDGVVFVSGQLPVEETGVHRPERAFEAQARTALGNLMTVLAAAGANHADVLKVTVYIVGTENWPAFDRVFAEMFGDAKPARSVVPVPALHYGYLVEIEAIAVRSV
jgi:enamine deaminase RidA (YjgF/YER057c/UK114 family)